MKRLIPLLALLAVVLTGCLPGLGTLSAVPVVVETPHVATAVFTPNSDVIDVIVNFAGGEIVLVQAEDPAWQCQPFRAGWDCFVTGQDDSAVPRVVHAAGVPVRFTVHATAPGRVVASAHWKAVR